MNVEPKRMNTKEKAARVAELRAELEQLTGRLWTPRDRKRFNENQKKAYKKRKAKIDELKSRHDPFCTCDDCFARAQAQIAARENA